MRKPIIGVMGPGDDAKENIIKTAFLLGQMIAENNWILLNGGRNVGVMNAVSLGAKTKNGTIIGVVPNSDDNGISEYLDIIIRTDMGQARNNINVLSSDIVISCGMNPGTASEIALAMRAGKKILMLEAGAHAESFFKSLDENNNIIIVSNPQEAVKKIESLLFDLEGKKD